MTEEKFDRIVENAADRFEKKVESAAQVIDDTLDDAMRYDSFRFVVKTLSYAGSIGLVVASTALMKKDYVTTARICLITGSIGVASNVLLSCLIRRK